MVLAAPVAAGTVTVAYGPDRYSKSAHYFNFAILSPNPQVTEPLLNLGEDFTPRPGLALGWERLPGGKLRLKLRPGVRFHNGEKMDAQAVLAALEWFSRHRSDFLHLDLPACRVEGEHTLVLQAQAGFSRLAENLTHPLVAMLWTGADPARGPVGTGPFVFGDYQSDRMLRVRRNPDYWGQAPPNQELVFRFIRDPQARIMAVASGQADVAFPLTPSLLASLATGAGYRLVASPAVQYIGLSVNLHGQPPFDLLRDVRVRRALGYAIDRQALVNHLFRGHGRPAKSLLPPVFWGQGDEFLQGYSYDPARAAALLDQAGWRREESGPRRKHGRELKLRLVSGWPAGSELKPIPEVLQQMLAQVGIGLEIVETDDHGVYYDGYMKPGKADLFLDKGFNSTADPTFLLFLLFHSQTPWITYGQNWFFPGAEFDAAVDRARQGRERGEVVSAIQEAQRILVDEKAALIPMVFVPDLFLVRMGVELRPAIMEYLTRYGYCRVKESVR